MNSHQTTLSASPFIPESMRKDRMTCRGKRNSGLRYLALVMSACTVIAASTLVAGCKTGPIPKEDRMVEDQVQNKHCRGRLCEEGR